MFGYAAFSETPYSTLPGGAFLAFISESASAQDAVLVAASTFNANNSESVQGADQSAVVASTFSAQSNEFSTASDSQTAQAVFPVSLAELASASESTVAALVLPGSVSETAQALDSVLAAQSHVSVIAESATASDLAQALLSLPASVSETATGADAASVVVVFRGAVAEQLSSSDLTSVAASIFNAVSQEQAQAQDSVNAPGSTYNPSASETAQALDATSAAATFPVAASETATIADQNAAAFTAATNISESATALDTPSAAATFPVAASETATAVDQTASIFTAVANISESATAADTTAALVAFAALTAENASASDQALVAPSTFNAIAAAAAQAFDSVNAPGSIYNAAVVNTAVALDSIIGAFLWNLIDNAESADFWTLISVAATSEPSWTSSAASPTALISVNYNSNPGFGAGYLLYTGAQTNSYTLPVTGGDNTISSAFYVNGQFFVIGVQYGSGVMLRSADGRNWVTVTVPNPSSPVLTVFGNGTQLGILNGGRTYISTDNGSTWVAGATGQSTFSYRTDVVWDGTKYVLNDGRRIRTSTDGLNWTIRFTAGVGRDRGSLFWTGTAFVALFSSVIGPTTAAQTRVSADGLTWNLPAPSYSLAVSLFQGPGFVGVFFKDGAVAALTNITSTGYTVAFLTSVPGYTYYPNDPYGLQVAQLGGLYFVPGVGGVAMTNKYITTTDFQSYAIRVVAGVSPWTGIDDSQNPNWQNISNS